MIPLVREPKKMAEWPPERCCFCRTGTRYWTKLAGRTPGEQVACCLSCAKTRKVADVPSKEAWFKAEMDRDREQRRQAGVRV